MRSCGGSLWRSMWYAAAAAALVGVTLGRQAVEAKTPDGMTPAQEQVCSGLQGAAFGLCNAYCEAQDCDVHPRPSCEQLRKNYEKVTGSRIFPCDAFCGDGVVNQASEQCDPPGSQCSRVGGVCDETCQCVEPLRCCNCPEQSMCIPDLTPSACLQLGCQPAPAGFLCVIVGGGPEGCLLP